jgi:hypothetical protein
MKKTYLATKKVYQYQAHVSRINIFVTEDTAVPEAELPASGFLRDGGVAYAWS